ncbi:MAG: hypothetical protein ACHREM_01145 [Polyangiales bacterium]
MTAANEPKSLEEATRVWHAMDTEERRAMAIAASIFVGPWTKSTRTYGKMQDTAGCPDRKWEIKWERSSREGGIHCEVGETGNVVGWYVVYGIRPHSIYCGGPAQTIAEAMLHVSNALLQMQYGTLVETMPSVPLFDIMGDLPPEIVKTYRDVARVPKDAGYRVEATRLNEVVGIGVDQQIPEADLATHVRWADMSVECRYLMARAAPILVGPWRRVPASDPWTLSHGRFVSWVRESRECGVAGFVGLLSEHDAKLQRARAWWQARSPAVVTCGHSASLREAMDDVSKAFIEMEEGARHGPQTRQFLDFIGGRPDDVPDDV